MINPGSINLDAMAKIMQDAENATSPNNVDPSAIDQGQLDAMAKIMQDAENATSPNNVDPSAIDQGQLDAMAKIMQDAENATSPNNVDPSAIDQGQLDAMAKIMQDAENATSPNNVDPSAIDQGQLDAMAKIMQDAENATSPNNVDPSAIDPRQLEAAKGMVTKNVTQGSDFQEPQILTSLPDKIELPADDSPRFGATSLQDIEGQWASQAEAQQKTKARHSKDAQDLKEIAREGKRIYQAYRADYEKRKAAGELWPEETREGVKSGVTIETPLSETQLARKLTGRDVEGGPLAALGDIYHGFQALTIDPVIKGGKKLFNIATTGGRQPAGFTGITGLTAEEEQGRRFMETKQTIEAEDAEARGEGPEEASLGSTIGDMVKGVITDPNIRNRFIEDTIRDLPATLAGAGALRSLATTIGRAKMLARAKKFAEKTAKANPKTTALATEIAAETPVGVGIEAAKQSSMGKEDIPVAELAAAEALVSVPTSIGVTAVRGSLKKLNRGTQESAEIESKFETKAVDIAERNIDAPANSKIPGSTAQDAPTVYEVEPTGTTQRAEGPPQGAADAENIRVNAEVGIDLKQDVDANQGYTNPETGNKETLGFINTDGDLSANSGSLTPDELVKEYKKLQAEKPTDVGPRPVDLDPQKTDGDGDGLFDPESQSIIDEKITNTKISGEQGYKAKDDFFAESKVDKEYADWFDESWALTRHQRKLEAEGKVFSDEARVDFAVDKLRGSKSAANQFIQDYLAPTYKKLSMKQGKKLHRYLTVKRAQWLYANKNGQVYLDADGVATNKPVTFWDDELTSARVDRMVAEIEAAPDFSLIEGAAQAHWDFNQKLADMREASGLWSPETRARVTQEPYYVPYVKPIAEGDGGFNSGKKFATSDNKIRKLYSKTSKEDAGKLETRSAEIRKKLLAEIEADPKGSTAKEIKKRIARKTKKSSFLGFDVKSVSKERAGKEVLLEMALSRARQDLDLDSPLLNPVEVMLKDASTVFSNVAKQRVFNNLVAMAEGSGPLKGLVEEVPSSYKKQAGEAIITTIKDGKKVKYKASPEFQNAVNGFGAKNTPGFLKLVVSTSGLFRDLAVGKNFDFAFANLPRDVQEAYMNFGYVSPLTYAKAAKDVITKGEYSKKYNREGGGMESLESGMKGAASDLESIMYGGSLGWGKALDGNAFEYSKYPKLARMYQAFKASAKSGLRVAELLGNLSEAVPRIAILMQAEKRGMSTPQAIHAARKSTVDFLRIGRKMKEANDVVPFLNVAVQGTDTHIRTVKNNPKSAAARWAASSAIPMLALTAWNTQNPHYVDVSRRDKENYWLFYLNKTDKHPIKIAKPHSAKLLTNPLQMWLETNVTKTMKATGGDLALSVTQGLAPVASFSAVLPPIILVPVEQLVNYNIYYDRYIVKNTSVAAGSQVETATSTFLKHTGKALNWSPVRMEHIARGLGAGTASNLLWVLDAGIKGANWDADEIKWKKAPFIKRIFSTSREWAGDLESAKSEIQKKLREYDRGLIDTHVKELYKIAENNGNDKTPEQKAQLEKQVEDYTDAELKNREALDAKLAEIYLAEKSYKAFRKANGLLTKEDIPNENE